MFNVPQKDTKQWTQSGGENKGNDYEITSSFKAR